MELCFWKNFSFLVLNILINFTTLAFSQDFPIYKCLANYTNNSPYKTNLNTLLSNLTSDMDEYGFYSSSFGDEPNKVHAIALCRGDLKHDGCRSCMQNATVKLTRECPNSKEAFGYFENCTLRHSNLSIAGTLATDPDAFMTNPNDTTSNFDSFNEALRVLLDNLRTNATRGDNHKKFSSGNVSDHGLSLLYGLMQCTPDLSADECNSCLVNAVSNIKKNCDRKIGCRILTPSCNLRFETDYRFFEYTQTYEPPPPPPAQPPAPVSPAPGKENNTTRTIIIIVSSIVGSVILVGLCFCIFARKKKSRENVETVDETNSIDISDATSLQYNFDTISVATNNFSDENKLGQGGFGSVYKGKLSNGQEIAVKRLAQNSGQGELEFKNEVMLVAKLSHRNLVRLIGFCLEGVERLLVYEFLPNLSLDQFIFDPIKGILLNWERRFKIINGIAKGLLYLHEDSRVRIIHRDLKASNVLLDAEMVPKIADFGIARLVVMDETPGSTSRIVGTYGYMPPEYIMNGHFSVKSDVFSFGVLILEIMTSQKNNYFRNGNDEEHLISHVWKSWRNGTAQDLIDPILRSSSGSTCEMLRCLHIGLLCVQENVADRPTMAAVVLMFSSHTVDLALPLEPAFFIGNSTDLYSCSKNEVSISELDPR